MIMLEPPNFEQQTWWKEEGQTKKTTMMKMKTTMKTNIKISAYKTSESRHVHGEDSEV